MHLILQKKKIIEPFTLTTIELMSWSSSFLMENVKFDQRASSQIRTWGKVSNLISIDISPKNSK